jgi:hypothetical protein
LPHEAKGRRLLWSHQAQRALALLARHGGWLEQAARPPTLEAPVDLSALPVCYRSLSAPQWNALLRHEARPCAAAITLIRSHRSGLAPLDEAHGFGELSHLPIEARILDCSADSLLEHRVDPSLVLALRELFAHHDRELPWRPLIQLTT